MTDFENKKKLRGKPTKNDEIDLVQLTKELWGGRKLVLKTVIIFVILGLFVAFLTPDRYSVTSIMIPQSSSDVPSKLGSLSSLAAMAGFNLNLSTGSDLSPLNYPQIVQSIPFQKKLMQTKLNFSDVDHPITYYKYYTKYYKPGVFEYLSELPWLIKDALLKSQAQSPLSDSIKIMHLTWQQRLLALQLADNVYVNVDQSTGNITLVAIMPEAIAAAELGQRAQELLQQFITEIKVKKAKAQLDFIKGRFEVKKKEYDQAQLALAQFQDQNKNLTSALANAEVTRLNNNYQLAFGVYSQLAQELENAQIQVKDNTPVFSVIDPITIPNQKYEPNRPLILIEWTLLGIFIGIGLLFGKRYWIIFRKKWNEEI